MKRPPQRKRRRGVTVPTASMGDIAFLLIIFFMVCSQVSQDKSNLEVVLPLSEYVKKSKVTVVARIAVDKKSYIYFNGDRVDSAKDVEWGVRAQLTKTVSDDQRHVQFTCDSTLGREIFEPVLKAIAEAGGIIDAVGELP